MKILEVYRAFDPSLGGVERHITDLCNCLVRRGHQPIILHWVVGVQPSSDIPAISYRIPMPKLVRIIRYLKIFYLSIMIAFVVRSQKIDLIHAHDYSSLIASTLAKGFCRVPVVVTFHLPPQREIAKWMNGPFNPLERFLLFFTKRKLSSGTCVSKYTLGKIIELGFPSDHFKLIYNWVNVSSVRVKHDTYISLPVLHTKYLLCVGRLDIRHKGQNILIDAFAKVSSRIVGIKLVIVGTGLHGNILRTYVKSKGLENFIVFMESIDERALSDLYKNCAAFVITSKIEGLPLVILEAMSHGKPVIATKVGGIPEIISHLKNGLLTTTKSGDIADAIMQVISNDNLAKQLGQEGFKEVTKRFSPANCELVVDFMELKFKESLL